MSHGLIRYIRPVVPGPDAWVPYLQESYTAAYFANFGPAAKQFERRLKDKYARERAVVTAPNATNGLVVALQALGVHGKVLMPAYTFPATAHAILMAGCTPLFCDVNQATWELAPESVRIALADPGLVAVMHVRAYGFSHDLTWLEDLARTRGIPVIVDAAAAIGAAPSIAGLVGQQGDMEVFSFHATKVFGIGEGAALFAEPRHEQRLRRASNFGIDYPDIVDAGQNSKLSDFQAAVGLAVLDRIDEFVRRRHEVARLYHQALARHPQVAAAPDPALSPWQSYPVRLARGMDVERVIGSAREKQLELKRGYYLPLHRSGYFSRFGTTPMPVTEALGESVVCLPVYSDMSTELADEVLSRFLRSLT